MPKVLLVGYDPRQPSFRHRMACLDDALRAAGWEVRIEQLPSGRYGVRTVERGALWRWADVTVLHQIKLSGPEALLFRAYARHSIFDVDDAIYVRKPRRLGDAPDEGWWRRRKFAATCRAVHVVAAGNQVLAGVARVSARAIEVLPTSIDVSQYRRASPGAGLSPVIVWIGSPENLIYLEMIRPALARLTLRHPGLTLRVICSRFPNWSDVRVEPIEWSAATEADALAQGHIGVMPLTDDAWSRGKCAFKLLQYMAAGLPCVASPVGANREAVIDGHNGSHATDDLGWERALEQLIVDPALRARYGANGFEHVRAHYALETYRARYCGLLQQLAGEPG